MCVGDRIGTLFVFPTDDLIIYGTWAEIIFMDEWRVRKRGARNCVRACVSSVSGRSKK